MSDCEEIEKTAENIRKIQLNKALANEGCEELILAAGEIIEKITQNRKTIEALVEEIKNNDVIIEEYTKKPQEKYDVDGDGFISMAHKKRK